MNQPAAQHRVEVRSIRTDLGVRVRPAIDVSQKLSVTTHSWPTVALQAPRCVAVPIRHPRLKVTGFAFGEGQPKAVAAAVRQSPAGRGGGRQSSTRIRPPRDVVKLDERLYLLLQPPVENLLANSGLTLPHAPYAFQWEGVAFLLPRHRAVLADEMGLGKTMQAITAVRLLARWRHARRVLVVCPKPLVGNWRAEIATWAPELTVAVVRGPRAERHWLWHSANAVVTIANYEVLLRDRAIVQRLRPRFDLAVLDEAQRIKNHTAATHNAVRAIPRRRSWALTGTPIENSTDDLVGIFKFLGSDTLRREMPARRMGHRASDEILRRTKDDVLQELPAKLQRDATVELSVPQRKAYQAAEDKGVVRMSKLGDALTIHHIFQLIVRLKQICNFDPATGASSKLQRLREDLGECTVGRRKAIVFSQWVGTLQRIHRALPHLNPLEYHGRLSSRQRAEALERFRADKRHRLLLMTYGAGGVGLNLQCAEYVFLFDRWWNPAVEDQAVHRAYRIGSRRPVTVTRMLAVDTIEARIDEILAAKRELFHSVFDYTRDPRSFGVSRDELFALFPRPAFAQTRPGREGHSERFGS